MTTQPQHPPGPKQPPRIHGEGCTCGDFARKGEAVTELKKPTLMIKLPITNMADAVAGVQLLHDMVEYERACKELAMEALERITNGELENGDKAMNGGATSTNHDGCASRDHGFPLYD